MANLHTMFINNLDVTFFVSKLTKKRDTSNCNHLHIIRELSFNEDELELIDFSTDGLDANDKEIIRGMIDELKK